MLIKHLKHYKSTSKYTPLLSLPIIISLKSHERENETVLHSYQHELIMLWSCVHELNHAYTSSRYNTITTIITVFWVGLLASCNTLAFVAGHLNFLQFYKWVRYRLKCFNFEILMQFEMLFCLKQSWITICEVHLLNDKYVKCFSKLVRGNNHYVFSKKLIQMLQAYPKYFF